MKDQTKHILNLSKEKLAALVKAKQRQAERRAIQATALRQQTRRIPLAFGQAGMWFLQQLAPSSPFYIVSIGLELRGELDAFSLGRALQEIVDRHETLRTRF